jgi:hypothetical protein
VENGVVVLEGGFCVPEGTQVSVIVPVAAASRSDAADGLPEGGAPNGTPEDDLVHPESAAEWASFFATKLVIGSAPASAADDELELTGDDLLF